MTESNLLIKSSTWVLAVSWVNRAMGLVSVFILARILSPEAFGAFAVLTIAVQLADVFTNFGVEQYYIQKKDATLSELNSGWTFNLLVKFFASVLLFSISGIIAQHFDKAYLTLAFQVMSLSPLLSAMSNGYIMHLKRTLEFQKFVVFSAIGQLIGSVLSIIIAFIYKNYWAFVIGFMVNTLVQVLLSYLVLTSRTRFTTTSLFSALPFGKWMVLKNIIGHSRAKFDVWFSASVFSLHGIGGYNTMKDIAMLPARELIGPLFQVLYSYMSNEKGSNERVYATCVTMLVIAVPSAVGIHMLANELTFILLGQRWLEYAPVLANLAVLTLSFTAGNVISDAIVSRGKVKLAFVYDLLTLLVGILSLFVFLSLIVSPSSLSFFRASIGIFMLITGLLWLSYCLSLSWLRLFRALFACSVAAGLMGLSISFALAFPLQIIFSLLISVIVGAAVYFASLGLILKAGVFSKEDQRMLSSFSHALARRFF